MTHYEVLGVATDATSAQIRRAYVRLAREHHPDYNPTDAGGRAAGERMRELNAAWSVLGDDDARAEYDRRLAAGAAGSSGLIAAGVDVPGIRIHRPSDRFVPFSEHDEDDDDAWRYEPDEVDPDTVPHRLVLIAPPALFVLGLSLIAVSLPTELRELSAVGLICLMLSALLFVGAPLVALSKSQATEERASRRTARSSSARPRAQRSARRPR